MKINNKNILIILTLGVFGIINTEMGVVGIMPLLAKHFGVSISQAGLFVSLFALAVAIAGPTMPLLISGINRKNMMIIVLSIFFVSNLIQSFTENFYLALIVRVIPAFLHPVYISLAFTVAAASASKKEAPKAVSKVMIGVSAGMVLGVPVVSFVANTFSLQAGMLVFAAVNALVLVATVFFVPSMEVKEKLTYGEQVSILKKPVIWLSIIAVIFLNGSIFGVYSYLAEYLASVTKINENAASMILMFYGLANIVGNMIAGKGLSTNPMGFVSFFPALLLIVYVLLYFTGNITIPAAIIILIWGVLAGAAANINQYWITSVTVKAPGFGNGLFLSATNLGTTIGTTICGFFISRIGISYVVLGGILLIILSFCTIVMRIKKYRNVSL
jgi:MFS transporter, DHA1 family, inner membrane transport protein